MGRGNGPARRRAGPGQADTGAVTAEFAVILPAVILIMVVLLALVRTVTVSMTCQDAAAVAVRELIVVADESDPVGAAQAVAGSGADVSVQRGGETVRVSVSCPVLPDPLGVLPTTVTADAVGVVQ